MICTWVTLLKFAYHGVLTYTFILIQFKLLVLRIPFRLIVFVEYLKTTNEVTQQLLLCHTYIFISGIV